MAVKKEYKQTDIGAIPRDWELMQLGSIAEVSAGGTPSRGVPEYWNGGIPWVTTTEVDFGRIRVTSQNISALGLKSSAAKLLNPGTILLALYGQGKTRGKVAILDIEATSNQACAAIVLSETVSRPFVFSYLASRYDFIRGLSNTGNQENLNGVIVKSIPIPLPPTLAEQEAIAAALSDADAWIESLEHLIAKKRQIKQGAMQELLTGKRRLPGFSGRWQEATLGEICTKIQDGTHFSPKLGGSDYLYLTSKNIRFGVLDLSTAERISANEHAKIYSRCDVRKGDLLLTKDGANTGNAAINTLEEPFSLLSSVALVRFDERVFCTRFFLYQLLSKDGQQQIKELMSGNAITRLTLQKIRTIECYYPQIQEQTAIATVLSDMDTEIESLESKLAKAREIKQGMMQELLTGKIRLV
jgi:type I restriction enzyme S subunit